MVGSCGSGQSVKKVLIVVTSASLYRVLAKILACRAKKKNGFKNSNNQRIESKSDSWFLMVELAVFLVHLPIFLVFIY